MSTTVVEMHLRRRVDVKVSLHAGPASILETEPTRRMVQITTSESLVQLTEREARLVALAILPALDPDGLMLGREAEARLHELAREVNDPTQDEYFVSCSP